MLEAEATSNSDTYGAAEMLEDLRNGIWRELSSGEAIDPFRRNLQRGHLERLNHLLTMEKAPTVPTFFSTFGLEVINVEQSDVRALVRGELEVIRTSAERASRRSRDRMSQLHLNDVVARIDKMLDVDS